MSDTLDVSEFRSKIETFYRFFIIEKSSEWSLAGHLVRFDHQSG